MWPEVMDVIIANSVWSRVIKAQPANNNYLPSTIYYLLSAVYIIYIFLLTCSDSVTLYLFLTMQ